MNIRDELLKNEDLDFKNFQSRLIPNLDPNKMIGVRIPVLRKIAKEAVKENVCLSINKNSLYEEKMVKGLMIGYKKQSIDKYKSDLSDFIPFIDNWAVCDCVCSNLKFAGVYKAEVFEFLNNYISKDGYQTRFAIVMLMDYFLCDEFIDKALKIIKSVKSDFYYVNMASSWALSVAFYKYPQKVREILENNELTVWVHNKTIQKCRESNRISDDDKRYLVKLKR